MTKALFLFVCLVVFLVLSGCISSGPKTQFYTLLPDSSVNFGNEARDKKRSLGVGPVILPEFLDHPGIVSLGDSNKVMVSGLHAWAGELKENISRVMASNLSAHLQLEQVWSFPWDNRVRPNYQLRLVFEDFSGARGGNVLIVCRWTLLNRSGNSVVTTGLDKIQLPTQTSSYESYVTSLNAALNRLALVIAEKAASLPL